MCVALFAFQSRLIYFPHVGREFAGTPADAGLIFEDVEIPTADGEMLRGWFIPAPGARAHLIFVHGNAGNVSHRIDQLAMLNGLKLSSLIFDYRGYGKSTGAPSEEGTYRDAEAAWKYLVEKRRASPDDIVLFGESLGGAVAAYLAAREQPKALIIVSSFTSVPDLAATLYPLFPARMLARFDYGTREYVKKTKSPVLVIHSRDDEIIPFVHGQKIFEAANEPKQFLEIEGGHNEAMFLSRVRIARGIESFLDSIPR
jgi:fermentation-respiration switch protein FrsA (DUF1100 family)